MRFEIVFGQKKLLLGWLSPTTDLNFLLAVFAYKMSANSRNYFRINGRAQENPAMISSSRRQSQIPGFTKKSSLSLHFYFTGYYRAAVLQPAVRPHCTTACIPTDANVCSNVVLVDPTALVKTPLRTRFREFPRPLVGPTHLSTQVPGSLCSKSRPRCEANVGR